MLAPHDVRRRPLLGVAGALAVAVLTVSGCSAGQDAQTVEQTSVVDGTAFEAGLVDLRDVGLRAPAGNSYAVGANAYLEGLVVNKASDTDQLVSVTTPAAGSVAFYADGVAALLGTAPTTSASASTTESGGSPTDFATPTTNTGSPSQGGTPNSTESAAETPSITDSATPTDGSSSTGTSGASSPPSASSSAAAATPLKQLPLPTNQSVQFGYANGQAAIVLLDLQVPLFPAETFPITFTFASGASVTATIAVKLPVDSSLDAPTVNTEEQEGGE